MQNGFTLIEIIVVITIMAVLSSIGVASFVTYGRSQVLTNATQDVFTALQLAKASASSQVKPTTDVCTAGVFNGYQVVITPSLQYGSSNQQNTYTTSPVCAGTPNSVEEKVTALPVNTKFSGSQSLTIIFHAITGTVTFSPQQSNAYADILVQHMQTLSNLTPTPPQSGLKVIRVYADGRINIQ